MVRTFDWDYAFKYDVLKPRYRRWLPIQHSIFNGSLFNHSCYPNVNIGWKSFSGDDQEFNDTLKQLNKSNECDEIDHCKPSVVSAGNSSLDNPFCLDDSNTIGYFKTNQSIKVGEELTISYVDAYKDCTVKKEELAFAYNIHCNECNCT